MKRRRAERIRRVVGVRKQMRRAAEWKLHELRRQEDMLRASQYDVLAALARDDHLLAGLAPSLSRRLCALDLQADALAAAGDRQGELVRARTGQLKQAERLERAVGVELERAGEKSGLEELVDIIAASVRATFR